MKNSICILLLAGLCATATLVGGEPDGPVVVLKDGTVLRGKGTNLGEKVAVELSNGGELKLLKTQVELIADSIDDAYLQRRERLVPDNILSQLSLAGWCFDLGMKTEANLHLKAAKKIDPTHPGISRLERRFRDQERAERDEELPPPKAEATAPEGWKDKLRQRVEDLRSRNRSQSSEISPASKIRFNKEVQPILLGSCAASNCHGPSSKSDFRLVRSSTQSDNHAVLVKRNLQSVLSRLNVEEPVESPLLENAIQIHAEGMRAAPLEISSAEFSVLIDWVIASTDDIKANPAAAATPKTPPSLSPNKKSPLDSAADLEMEGDGPAAERRESKVASSQSSSSRGAKSAPKSRAGKSTSSKKYPPPDESDPVSDPEEFNQRYFPKNPK